jgi:hypothetical protein
MTDSRLGRSLVVGAVVAGTSAAFASCSSSSSTPPPVQDLGGDSGSLGDSTVGDDSSQDTGTAHDSHEENNQCVDAGETLCANLCVNTQTDVNNCGTCAHSCGGMGGSAYCQAGMCVCNPDAGLSLCGTSCVDTLTDPSNCGTCGHICQASGGTGTCAGGICQATVVAAAGGPIFGITVDANYVWWTQPVTTSSPGQLLRKAFASGSTIGQIVPTLPDPQGITGDNNNVYWVDYVDTSVDQLDKMGLVATKDWPVGATSTTYAHPIQLAINQVSSANDTNIYWASNTTGTILSVPENNTAGTAPTVIATGQNYPYAVAVYGSNVFWTNQGTAATPPYNGSVVQASTGGGGTPITLSSGDGNPIGIATDGTNVYWVDNTNPGLVKQVPVGGGTVITLAQNEGSPYGIAIDPPGFGSNVYWTAFSDNTVNSVPIGGVDGGGKTVLATQQNAPSNIVVTEKNIYWVNTTAQNIVEITK